MTIGYWDIFENPRFTYYCVRMSCNLVSYLFLSYPSSAMNGNSLRPAVPFSPGRFTMLSVVLGHPNMTSEISSHTSSIVMDFEARGSKIKKQTCSRCHLSPSLVEQSSGLVASDVPLENTSSFGTPSLDTLSHLLALLLTVFSFVGLGLCARFIQ